MPGEPTESELERTLGLLEATMIGVGTMLGAGIFVLPGPAAEAAGPVVVLSFVVGGCIALLTALSASELATAMPRSGGSYHFVFQGLGPFWGTVAGFGNWIGLAFASAFYVVGFGGYLALLLDAVYTAPTVDFGFLALEEKQVGGLLGGAAFVLVNYLSTEDTGKLQNVVVVGLLGILAVFCLLAAVEADVDTLRPFAPDGWDAVLPAAALVFVSYLGFVKITTVAGEVKDPGRNLPRALVGSVVLVTVIYAVVMTVVLGVLPRDEIAGSETVVADVASVVFDAAVGSAAVGLALLTFAGLLATASSANASILAASRINYAMGRDGVVTTWFNEINWKHKTPYRAILVTGALTLAFVVAGDIAVLAKSASVLHLVVYGLLNLSVIAFRESTVTYEPAYRLPVYPYVPFAGAASSFALIYWMNPADVALALAFLFGGLAWYLVYARKRTTDDSALAELRRTR